MEAEVVKIKFVFELIHVTHRSNWIVWVYTNFSSHLDTVSAITGIIYGPAGQRVSDLIFLTLM